MSDRTLSVQEQTRLALEAFDEAREVVGHVETAEPLNVRQHQSELALHVAFAETFNDMVNAGEMFLSDN